MKAIKVSLLWVMLGCFSQAKAGVTATVTPSDHGSNNGTATLSIAGGVAPYTIVWTGPGGFADTAFHIEGLAPGEYCATVTDHFCGQASLCITVDEKPVTGIASVAANNMNIFPNPFDRTIHITLGTPLKGEGQLQLHDMTGKLITSQEIGPQPISGYTLQLTNTIPAGTYILSVKTTDGALLLRKQVTCLPTQ